jgi:hypothetical protein
MDHFVSLGWLYVSLQLMWTTLFVIALRTRNERFHAMFALIGVTALLIYPVTNFDTVQRAPVAAVNR